MVEVPPELRTEEHVDSLMRILGVRLKSFARFSTTQKVGHMFNLTLGPIQQNNEISILS